MSAIDPDESKWEAWKPTTIARLLERVRRPWYVAAGWAIDLFLGGERREHEDLEIAVPNTRFDEVAEVLDGFEIFVITDKYRGNAARGGARPASSDTHQTWIREPATGVLALRRLPRAVRTAIRGSAGASLRIRHARTSG